MEWRPAEYLIYDGTKECAQAMVRKDLFTNTEPDGEHLCEMYSPTAFEDYGRIEIGDVMMIVEKSVWILRCKDEDS